MVNLRFCLSFLLLIASLGLATAQATQPISCGKDWINLHKKNPDLLGVYVQQVPDNKTDASKYQGTHPAMVIYVFKGGRAHQIEYTPSGQVENGFWWDIPPDDWIYKKLDANLKQDLSCAFWVKP